MTVRLGNPKIRFHKCSKCDAHVPYAKDSNDPERECKACGPLAVGEIKQITITYQNQGDGIPGDELSRAERLV